MATLLSTESADSVESLQWWNDTNGTVTYETTVTLGGGHGCYKMDNGGASTTPHLQKDLGNSTANVRVNFFCRFADAFTTETNIFLATTSSEGNEVFRLIRETDGTLHVENDSGTNVGSGTAVLGQDTEYRICIAYAEITSVTGQIKVYVQEDGEDAVLDIDIATFTIDHDNPEKLWVGLGVNDTSPGTAIVGYFGSLTIDDGGYDDGDMGNVRVTFKLPLNSGGTNGFDGQISTGEVDDVPFNELTGHTHAATSDVVESSDIETVANGADDISSDTQLYYQGYVRADRGNGGSGSPAMITADTEQAISLNAGSPSLFRDPISSATYPSGTDQIGLRSTNAGADSNWYDGGILIAYIVAAAGGDPEVGLIGGKLLEGGLLVGPGALVR